MEFKDKRILITGASAGIGAEFARQLHALGASVTLVARREDRIKSLALEFNGRRPGSAEYLVSDLGVIDLSKPEGVGRVVEYIRTNQVDVLVNNAGRGSFGNFDELEIEEELQMVALNISATMILANSVIPQMKSRGSGAIVSLSSISAFQPLPYMASYAATKAFNLTHSLGLRYELAAHGIRVVTVCPGPTATEFPEVSQMTGRAPGKGYGKYRSDSVQAVVRESIWALQKNKAYVVPCLRGKLLCFSTSLLPRAWMTAIVGKMLKAAFK